MTVSTQVQARLCEALKLFIQTVNPPYPQSMALWQEHLKAATENAKAALTAAADVGEQKQWPKEFWDEFLRLRKQKEVNATIECCAQVAENCELNDIDRDGPGTAIAAAIRALKDKP